MMTYILSVTIPLFILWIFLSAIFKKVDILNKFSEGVMTGLETAIKIFPYILAITISITLLQETGAMNAIISPIKGILVKLKIPQAIVPLSIFRPLSGGASTSVVMDIFKKYGPDSLEGKMASIIMGGTETTFYSIAILYGSSKTKKIRGTLIAGLIADFVAITTAVVLVNLGII